MRGLFNYNGYIFSTLSKIGDLVILNLVTLVFCIPIVTIGPTLTAAHYAALKIKRNENYVLNNFWKSFKENFKQSTLIGLILLSASIIPIGIVIATVGINDFLVSLIRGIMVVVSIFSLFVSIWIYPLQSKFSNTITMTLKYSVAICFKYLFRTIFMAIIYLLSFLTPLIQEKLLCYAIIFGLSLPIYLSAVMYDKLFEQIENSILEREGIITNVEE